MRVIPVAATTFFHHNAEKAGYVPHDPVKTSVAEADELAEFAGRLCYKSWNRPNPKTASNDGYISNILAQKHESVLEHASVSFYVDGVSRSLLAELSRHRHLSFSVVSQRFVDMSDVQFVIPPGLRDVVQEEVPDKTVDEISDAFQEDEFFGTVREHYSMIVDDLEGEYPGMSRKQVREIARLVLPNCTESPMVVTGNLRAWRDVLGKRYHIAADAEIQEFATLVLEHLRVFAPNSVTDLPDHPFGEE